MDSADATATVVIIAQISHYIRRLDNCNWNLYDKGVVKIRAD